MWADVVDTRSWHISSPLWWWPTKHHLKWKILYLDQHSIAMFNKHNNIFDVLVHFLNVNRGVKVFHIEKCQDRELERVWNLTFVTKKLCGLWFIFKANFWRRKTKAWAKSNAPVNILVLWLWDGISKILTGSLDTIQFPWSRIYGSKFNICPKQQFDKTWCEISINQLFLKDLECI